MNLQHKSITTTAVHKFHFGDRIIEPLPSEIRFCTRAHINEPRYLSEHALRYLIQGTKEPLLRRTGGFSEIFIDVPSQTESYCLHHSCSGPKAGFIIRRLLESWIKCPDPCTDMTYRCVVRLLFVRKLLGRVLGHIAWKFDIDCMVRI
ncbi:hypothetical protein CDAR_216011 [Caerostris darwini]|uniref:Uncharacterized protein n=1 Tax=Caerostris darwini TaxID=1538125 RepID=A0AAV4NL77_9ARAC|nr:hypothetical protein CDAR_216011 [Caerostris darwini]